MGQRKKMGPRPTRAHLISWAAEGIIATDGMCRNVCDSGDLPNVATLWEGSCALSEEVVDNEVEPNCIGSQKVMIVTCTCSQAGNDCNDHHALHWGHRLQPGPGPHIALTKAVSCGLGAHGVERSVELQGPHVMISCLYSMPRISLHTLSCVVLAA